MTGENLSLPITPPPGTLLAGLGALGSAVTTVGGALGSAVTTVGGAVGGALGLSREEEEEEGKPQRMTIKVGGSCSFWGAGLGRRSGPFRFPAA
jgi:hypothetical protein